MRRTDRCRRRGAVLLMVMVMVGSLLFLATGLIFMMQASAATTAVVASAEQSRALARSGLAIIQQQLDQQRDAILNGEAPTLDAEYTIYETAGELGIVRIVPIGPQQELLVSEDAKLDLNSVDAAGLIATGLIDPILADSIIAHRNALGRPFQSPAELLFVEGMTPELLLGALEPENGDAELRSSAQETVPALADVVTVFSFAPALQRSGDLCINLNVEWTDELRARVAKRWGEQVADALRQIFESGFKFENDGSLVALLRQFNVELKEWIESVDAITTTPHEAWKGRLDINLASYEALMGLPGMTAEMAVAMIDLREKLSGDDRATIVWPVMYELMTPEQFQPLAGRIATRSWNWRVRIEAGINVLDSEDDALEHRVVYEAVVDLSSPRARLAYLRDVTYLNDARAISTNAALDWMEDSDNTERVGDDPRRSSDNDLADDAPDDDRFLDDEDNDSSSGENSRSSSSRDLNFGSGNRPEVGRPEGTDRDDEDDAATESAGPPAPRPVGRWRAGS
ncbi:MAG: helix-hairpin-helix domain-containing protein [Phycisphaerales bacterium]